jgi:indole-3-glycerol phosphate synthase
MNILEEILKHKLQELALTKKAMPEERLKDMSYFSRRTLSLQDSLRNKNISVIAEIKKASPSKGIIRTDFDPLSISQEYVTAGASAISVLTDEKYFHGNIKFISDIRATVPIPILRKDFLIDPYQLVEAKAFGADAVLLIAAALGSDQLHDLYNEAAQLGLDCLVEVHNEEELAKLDLKKIKIIGINNRDLSNFAVDISTSARIASNIPEEIIIVSESGISNNDDIEYLKSHGIRSVLIGESFMRMASPGKALKAILTPPEG